MEDVFDANWRTRFRARHPAVEAELASLVDIRGTALVEQPEQLRLLLTQACPDAPRHIGALLAAVSAGVAGRLRAASDDASLPDLLRRSVQDVRRHGIDDPDWAWWAVRTWAHAFALPTSGAGRDAGPAPTVPRVPFAPWRDAPDAPPAVSPASRAPAAAAVAAASPAIAAAPPAPVASPPPGPVAIPARDAEPASDRREPALAADTVPIVAGPATRTDFPPTVAESRPDADPAARPRARRPAAIAAFVGVPVVLLLGWFAIARDGATPPEAARGASSTVGTPVAPPDPRPQPARVAEPVVAAAPPPAPPRAAPAPEVAKLPTAKPTPADASASAPSIARIDVPHVDDGASFTVVLRMSDDARDIVGVERRFVASEGAWPRYGPATVASGMRRSGATLSIPFRAVDAPARATIEFVALDRDGHRSEPKVATVVVGPAASAGAVAGAAADGCTPATCGIVVESAEIDPGASYRIVVRTDDGQTRAFTLSYRLQSGIRARLVGGRLVPAGAGPS